MGLIRAEATRQGRREPTVALRAEAEEPQGDTEEEGWHSGRSRTPGEETRVRAVP